MDNIRRVDLNLLGILSVLLKEQNLTRAAENLGMTQSAVSHALKRLRALYNDPLFKRKSGKMKPTAKAQALAPRIEYIINEIKTTLPTQSSPNPADFNTHFRINIQIIGHTLITNKLIERVSKQAPNVTITMTTSNAKNPDMMLKNRELDIVIQPFKMEDVGCHAKTIYADNIVVVARKDHPRLSQLDAITLEDYLAEAHAVMLPMEDNIYPLAALTDDFSGTRKVRYQSENMQDVLRIVAVTDYLCVVPEFILASATNRQDYLFFRPPFGQQRTYDIYMCWYWGTEHFHDHRWLRQMIVDISSEQQHTLD
ncbi:LysR family transcriptional regulator [Thalassotalea sp. Y01]|uniref:LysR substrate-binding domain-containing protein n=1 Tax=Thalassotalea sp. Y01 TaxID=2729613 RepID=UPI00145C3D58|nr:LysR family transcriptional regulator [Thalassotalea sp. Y01]NMP15291.1 LysR family transcriptional regulator [Thalassotalea sp. Y01]